MFPSPADIYAQALQAGQAAWNCESAGNAPAASGLYSQAANGFTACLQMAGVTAPPELFFQLGFTQMRLAWLNGQAGNAVWAQQWLAVALPNLQAAWQRNPAHPQFRMCLHQAATALGHHALAAQVAAPPMGMPGVMPGMMPPPPAGSAPGAAAGAGAGAGAGGESGAGKMGDWLETGKKAMDLFGKMFGDGAGSVGSDASANQANPWGFGGGDFGAGGGGADFTGFGGFPQDNS